LDRATPAIADGARRIKAKSFTIDGEAVVLGPNGLSRLEELSRREAADTAILYAFDLVEHDGEDMRNRPLLDRKAALAAVAQYQDWHPVQRTDQRGRLYRLRARLPAWRRRASCQRRSIAPIDCPTIVKGDGTPQERGFGVSCTAGASADDPVFAAIARHREVDRARSGAQANSTTVYDEAVVNALDRAADDAFLA
jgi:hypothetical protein